jgi:D-threo-aldose 1-dehydrogenase
LIGSPFSQDFLPLGFGCAWLSGGRWTARSLRLIEAAHDAGIRYFDTARMYGSGEAEEVLGRFLPKRHEDIIVTSKAGILPRPHGRLRRWARRGARLIKPDRAAASWRDDYRFGMFDTPGLRKSVETSLRKLRTDRLDALLLHEVDTPDLADGAVMTMLEDLRKAGMVGSYGFASTRDQTRRLVAEYGGRVSIVQTASTVLEDGLAPLGDRGRFLTITHTVLAGALEKIAARLAADGAFSRQWTALTGVDSANREAIAELLLAEALDANQNGIVLFSSTSPARIKAAARVARERPYAPQQIAGLRELAGRMRTSP